MGSDAPVMTDISFPIAPFPPAWLTLWQIPISPRDRRRCQNISQQIAFCAKAQEVRGRRFRRVSAGAAYNTVKTQQPRSGGSCPRQFFDKLGLDDRSRAHGHEYVAPSMDAAAGMNAWREPGCSHTGRRVLIQMQYTQTLDLGCNY